MYVCVRDPPPMTPVRATDPFSRSNPGHRWCDVIFFFWLRLLQLGGLTLLAMGIWVSVDRGSFLQLMGPFSREAVNFVNVGFFCIAVGAVLLLLGLLGCCGAHKKSKCLLLVVGVSEVMRSHDTSAPTSVRRLRGVKCLASSHAAVVVSSSLQFSSIILIIFVAEVAAAVVALAYSSFVSSSSSSSSSLLLPASSLFCPLLLPHLATTLSTLSPCKFVITAANIIELPPHFIQLLNDSGMA